MVGVLKQGVRGVRAGGYLLVRGVSGILTLGILPMLLILVLVAPPFRRVLERAVDEERVKASRYLGREPEPPAPVVKRPFWQLHKEKATGRAVRLVLTNVVLAVPVTFVAAGSLLAAPSAVAGMVFWPLDPNGPSLMGASVDSWGEALTLGPLQILTGLALLRWAAPAAATRYAQMVLRLLAPSPAEAEAARLAARVDELTRTRAGAVDSHGAELRRIERDLHDGTQAQLVSLAMRIGVAKKAMLTDPDRAAELLDDARDGAEQAMTELRGVLRTMYPPILADRGLAGAVSALAARSQVPAQLRAAELGDVPAAVEAAAYFVVAESLTNVAKHAVATSVDIELERQAADLVVRVTDDGIGGAELPEEIPTGAAQRGTGLAGMVHRVQAIDGRLDLHSPVGGPTTVAVTLPCE